MDAIETYRVRAHNTAPDSENRIHDDRTAAAYGFRGGLVPGVTVYGYMTVPVVQRFGEDWLARGGMEVRFLKPVYEGDEVTVTLSGDRVESPCSTAKITWPAGTLPDLARYPEAALPAERPPASAASLAPGRILGTLHVDFAVPEGILYTAQLLTYSNYLLMQNVQLGPWIHVGSELRNFSLAREAEKLSVRGRVADRYERKGHRFVVLDILLTAGGRLVQQVRHTAIYEPRVTPASPVSPSTGHA